MARIIVVEDDLAQQEEILSFLAHVGHEAIGVDCGSALDVCLDRFAPEVILLDYNLPDENGSALAERLRARFGLTLGIVMVTARSMSKDRVECRRAGADDYLVKPVEFDEILLVIDNLLSRIDTPSLDPQVWKLILAQSSLLAPNGTQISLGGSEVLLLVALAQGASRKASRNELIRALGKNPDFYDSCALETFISRLRHKLPALKDGRNPLRSLRGMGYQFIPPLQIAT